MALPALILLKFALMPQACWLYCELLWVYLVGLALVVLRASLFGVEFHQLVLASEGSPGVFHIDVIHLVLQWVASKVVVSPLVHSFGLPSTSCG